MAIAAVQESKKAVNHDPLHSTNTLERINKELKRRTQVVGIFPNRDSLVSMVATLLNEQDDEWQVADRRYFSVDSMKRTDQQLEGGERESRQVVGTFATAT